MVPDACLDCSGTDKWQILQNRFWPPPPHTHPHTHTQRGGTLCKEATTIISKTPLFFSLSSFFNPRKQWNEFMNKLKSNQNYWAEQWFSFLFCFPNQWDCLQKLCKRSVEGKMVWWVKTTSRIIITFQMLFQSIQQYSVFLVLQLSSSFRSKFLPLVALGVGGWVGGGDSCYSYSTKPLTIC